MKKNAALLSITGVLLIAVLVVVTFPQLAALSYQIQGGQLLEQAILQDYPGLQAKPICAQGRFLTQNTTPKVLEAVEKLQHAIEYNSGLSQAYLLLARARCLLNQPQSAVDALNQYITLRPGNPMGYIELGFGLEAVCMQSSDGPLCMDDSTQRQIRDAWTKGDLVKGYFLHEALYAFDLEDYRSASRWFYRSLFFGGDIPKEYRFRWMIASIAGQTPLPSTWDSSVVVYPVNGTTLIEGETLYWLEEEPTWSLSYGDLLSAHPSNDPSVGIMWWAGRAVSFLNVEDGGTYQIRIRLQDTPPGPIQLQVEKNFVPIDRLVLANADGNWHDLTVATELKEGYYLLSLNYLEDFGDATIDWLSLERID